MSIFSHSNLPDPEATRGRMLSFNRVKLFTDGALGTKTAALSQPYVGTCHYGVFLHKQVMPDTNAGVTLSRSWLPMDTQIYL